MSDMQRREVFTSLASRFRKDKEVTLRPPYYEDISLFDKECLTCKEKTCVTFCEEEIICIDEKGRPYLEFKNSGCTYCDSCASACSKEVLNLLNKKQIDAQFSIDTKTCLSWNETICSSCLDVCDKRAIKFFGMFRPIIDISLCNSCGFCIAPCPSDAIAIKGV